MHAYKPVCQAILIDDIDCNKYDFKFDIELHNVGKKDGDEVVIIYSKPPNGIDGANIKQVIGLRFYIKEFLNKTYIVYLYLYTKNQY